jgi:predicted ATPase/DNA-binding SARP family transcriptional activator
LASFRIIGPIEAVEGDERLALGGRTQLALFAFLLLNANRAISIDVLNGAVWGSARSARDSRLKMAIARLRHALEPANTNGEPRLQAVAGGYMLSIEPGELDTNCFQARVEDGRRAFAAGDPARARELLDDALRLWRGRPLAEVEFLDFVQAEIRRLEELRLTAIEARADAELALGRHEQLIPELDALLTEQPTRERVAAQLMLALYRCGRQPDALEVYQRIRAHLTGEFGLEPGPALRKLQADVLGHAPSLDATAENQSNEPGGGSSLPAPADEPPRSDVLPAAPSSTIGRRELVRAVCAMLAEPDARLLTLTGPGGVGKTRVALEVAHALRREFPDGTYWVELAGVARPDDVGSSLLRALAAIPAPGEGPGDALRRYLAPRRLLLVIDNFEHLLEAAELLGELHQACPDLRILVTSREALNLSGEHRVIVAPLASPPETEAVSVAEIEAADASTLFMASARRRDSRFSITGDDALSIARICGRLDGLPLALELAAARVGVLGVEELATRLERTAGALGTGPRDAPARHRTLDATIDWSYRLLDADLRATFAHFSVFAGGATLEAAQSVIGAGVGPIEALITKSLLEHRPQADGSTRVVMLETVRQYALERLGADPCQAVVRRAHHDYYLRLAELAAPRLWTRDERPVLVRIESDIDNFHAALRWALENAPLAALQLACLLSEYWEISGDTEGSAWLGAAIAAAGERAPARDRARALIKRARQLLMLYEFSEASEAAATALELSRQVDDHAGISAACDWLAQTAPVRGRPAEARAFAEDACRHASLVGDDLLLGRALLTLATRTLPEGEWRSTLERGTDLLKRSGSDRDLVANYSDAGWFALQANLPREAAEFLDVALAMAKQAGTPAHTMMIHGNIGWANLLTRDFAQARRAFTLQLQLCSEYGFSYGAHEAIAGLAALSANNGELDKAAQLLGAAQAMGWPSPDAQATHDRLERDYFAPAKAAYGIDAWQREERGGAGLSAQEAITWALAEARPRAAARQPEHPQRVAPQAPARTYRHRPASDASQLGRRPRRGN